MIETIADLPANVLGFRARGTVTAEDYEATVIPAVEEFLRRGDKVRLLFHLGAGFESFEGGALWDDAKLGLAHLRKWERIALVTDVEKIRAAVKVFRFAMPGRIRVFHDAELAAALRWIGE